MKQSLLLCVSAVLISCLSPAGSLAEVSVPELITNGSFEKGSGEGKLEPASTAMTGWTIINGSIDLVGADWSCADGDRCLDLEGDAAFGGVSQTIKTDPGKVYNVRFDLAGNPDCAPTVKRMRVSAAGQTTERWFDTRGYTRNDLGWETNTWQFLAVEAKTTIEFISIPEGPGHCGPMLDSVSVTLAPQPWSVRRRVMPKDAPGPADNAKSVTLPLKLNKAIPMGFQAGTKDQVTVKSVAFMLQDDWLEARIETVIQPVPSEEWRMVLELLNPKGVPLRRVATSFRNIGSFDPTVDYDQTDQRTMKLNLGPWKDISAANRFRLSVEVITPPTSRKVLSK